MRCMQAAVAAALAWLSVASKLTELEAKAFSAYIAGLK